MCSTIQASLLTLQHELAQLQKHTCHPDCRCSQLNENLWRFGECYDEAKQVDAAARNRLASLLPQLELVLHTRGHSLTGHLMVLRVYKRCVQDIKYFRLLLFCGDLDLCSAADSAAEMIHVAIVSQMIALCQPKCREIGRRL